jgi:hypothetical protein
MIDRSGFENSPRMDHEQDCRMPSFFMREYSIDRLIPRRTAAPLGTESTQFVSKNRASVLTFSLLHPGRMREQNLEPARPGRNGSQYHSALDNIF